MTETKDGEAELDSFVAWFGAERYAELDKAATRMAARSAERKAAANAKGYDLAFLGADLTVEQVQSGLVDRTGWGEGPWDGEPDAVMWAAREPPHYRCMAWRMGAQLGHFNGYVAIPKGHPAWGLDYDAEPLREIDAHGGLTFCGRGIDDSWVFGFDCAHYLDWQPGHEAFMRAHMPPDLQRLPGEEFGPVYKTVDFVRAECESLARQLARIAKGAQP